MSGRTLKKKRDSGFLWKMIELQRAPLVQLFAIVAFVLLFRMALGTWRMALVTMVSIYLHEWGHNIVLIRSKIQSQILFLFPLGAAAVPKNEEENEKSDLLPSHTLTKLMLVGPAVNVGLIVLGLVLVISENEVVSAVGIDLVFINTMLSFFNLLPLWKVDAGQFLKIVFLSIDRRSVKLLQLAIVLTALLLISLAYIVPNEQFSQNAARLNKIQLNAISRAWIIIFSIALLIGARTKKRKGVGKENTPKLSTNQLVFNLVVYTFLVMITLFVISLIFFP